MANIERKSRIVIGVLALIALLGFLATTFGSSDGVLIATIATGITLGILLITESSIVSYVKNAKYRNFSLGDLAVYLGVIAGVTIIVFSISLIPTIGEILPVAITSFTTTFARAIAAVAAIMIGVFIFTPRFD